MEIKATTKLIKNSEAITNIIAIIVVKTMVVIKPTRLNRLSKIIFCQKLGGFAIQLILMSIRKSIFAFSLIFLHKILIYQVMPVTDRSSI